MMVTAAISSAMLTVRIHAIVRPSNMKIASKQTQQSNDGHMLLNACSDESNQHLIASHGTVLKLNIAVVSLAVTTMILTIMVSVILQ